MRRRTVRVLTAEERQLWSHVARDVVPLDPSRRAAPAEAPPAAAPAPAAPPRPRSAPPAPRAAPPPLVPLDRTLRRRLARGTQDVEARLDLHGLTQAAAHRKLAAFLRRAQADGLKLVVVITGKGTASGWDAATPERERGVLRRMVPHWLGQPDLRPVVVGFEEAAPGHGGAGALYVRIRRVAPRG